MGNFHNDHCPFCNPDSQEKSARHAKAQLQEISEEGRDLDSLSSYPPSEAADTHSLFSVASTNTTATMVTNNGSTRSHVNGTLHNLHINHGHDESTPNRHPISPQSKAAPSEPNTPQTPTVSPHPERSFWSLFRGSSNGRDSLRTAAVTASAASAGSPPPPPPKDHPLGSPLAKANPLPPVPPKRSETTPNGNQVKRSSLTRAATDVTDARHNKFDRTDKKLETLLENNKRWADTIQRERPNFFREMTYKQEPKILWIGCSDSRVPPNHIIQLDPGEIFVHRNIANVVVHNDLNCLSVIQYAIEVLKVEHVIICGHYGCGGVNGAMHGHQYGLIDNWLMNIKDVFLDNKKELQLIKDPQQRERRLVELNVHNSVRNVCCTDIVQDAWRRGQNLSIHGWCYELQTGLVHNTDLFSGQKHLEDIYRFN